MFGYITPVQGELTVNDLNKFKSYYCGLCMCIKENFGNIPRIFLNYDVTFFAVLLDGLSIEDNTVKITNCIRHPSKKRKYITNNSALNYASNLNIALTYYKLLDNVLDDKDLKSLSSSKILKYYYKRINDDTLKNTIKNSLDNLHNIEKSDKSYSIDEISHPFSKIIGTLLKNFPGKLEDDSEISRNYLYNFGYSLGKWIYLIDALDDLKEDMNNNVFNPIEKAYNLNSPYEDLLPQIKENIDFTLMNLVINCNDLINKMLFTKNLSIIENVVNLGLVNTYTNILCKL